MLILLFPEDHKHVVRQAQNRICYYQIYLVHYSITLGANRFLLIQVQRILQRKCLEQGIAQRSHVSYDLSSKDISLPDHQSTKYNTTDTIIMYFFKVIRQIHDYSDYQYEKDYKLFEGHKGCEWHDGDAIGRQDVNGTHDEGIRQHIQQNFSIQYEFPIHCPIQTNNHDPLNQKNLNS